MFIKKTSLISIGLFFLSLPTMADMVDHPGFKCSSGPAGNDFCENSNVKNVSGSADGGSSLIPESGIAEDTPSNDEHLKRNYLRKHPNGIEINADQNAEGQEQGQGQGPGAKPTEGQVDSTHGDQAK
jgi:hypothetical protein